MTAAAKRASWPHKSHADLRKAGYVYIGPSTCRGARCRKQILWYRTPAGRLMPIDSMTYTPHHATCADAKEFEK